MKNLKGTGEVYQIERYEHSLQTATRAYRDGVDEEMIVVALLHDIGDTVAMDNHSELAAAVLRPYIGDRRVDDTGEDEFMHTSRLGGLDHRHAQLRFIRCKGRVNVKDTVHASGSGAETVRVMLVSNQLTHMTSLTLRRLAVT